MFLGQKKNAAAALQEDAPKVSFSNVDDAPNPLMQHYLKRKREALEEAPPQKKMKTTAEFVQSESQLSSMLFHGAEGLLHEMDETLTNTALGNMFATKRAKHTRKCCWKRDDSSSHDLIQNIPQNSIQFKALTQYMNRNNLTILTHHDYEHAMRHLYERQHPTPQWITDARDLRSAESTPESSIFSSTQSLLSKSSLSYTGTNLAYSEKVRLNAELFAGMIQNVHTSPHSNILSILSGRHTVQLLQFSSASSASHDQFPLIDVVRSRAPLISAYFHRDQKHLLFMKSKETQLYSQEVELVDLQTGKRSVLRLLDDALRKDNTMSDRFFSTYGCATSTSHSQSSDFFAFGDESAHGQISLFGTNSVFPDHTFHSGSPVKSLSFSADNRYMFSAHANSQVKVWDIRQRRPLLTHWDDGATDTTSISCNSSTTSIHYSTGSSNGVVNVYSLNEVASQSEASTQITRPKAKKAITNLVTPISDLKYNNSPDGSTSLLAFSSVEADSAFRLANPQNSYKVFSNFPSTPDYSLKYRVSSMAFSARGDQLFIAYKGWVNMYSLG